MDSESNPQKKEIEIKEVEQLQEKKILSNEVKQFYEQSQKLFEVLQKGKGKLYFKNNEKNFNIILNNKSFCKIFEQSSLVKKLKNYIIINETTVKIDYSNELYDDNNGKIFQFIQNRSEFPVIMAKDMNTENEKKIQNHIILKSKSINNILSKIGSLNETTTYIQISITQVSFDYSTKILKEYIINKYNFLLDSKKIFYIVFSILNKEEENEDEEEEEELEKYALSYYSIKKIMDLAGKDGIKREKYLNLSLINEDTEEFEKENRSYLNNLTKSGENMEIYKKFEQNTQNNIKNILENNIKINRMKKVDNNEMNQCFNIFEEIINKKDEIKDNKDDKKEIEKKNKDEKINKEKEEKLERMKNKKKEIGEAINNRYNRFIEIMHKNKDKKYINLQYLDLMEDFNKKYGKYKIDYYQVKNDRFKDVQIPAECINNYMRYKSEYEKKQFVLVKLNDKEIINYLVSLKDLKKLYDDWTDFDKEQEINTENPQFEGKRINLDKTNVVIIGELKELPEQPDLIKKIKEEKEENDKIEQEEKLDKESSKIYGDYPNLYKNANEKDYIIITRVIKRKKKKGKKEK